MSAKEIPQQGVITPAIRCSANFPHDGNDIAVSLLLVQMSGHLSWLCYPRCAEHPAETYDRLLSLIDPKAVRYVMPLRPRMEVVS